MTHNQLSEKAAEIATSRPRFWELALFAQVITDEIERQQGLSSTLSLSTIAGADSVIFQIDTGASLNDCVAWVQSKLTELADLINQFSELLDANQNAFGLSGQSDDPEKRFYAAFATDEEFRIVACGKTLGTLPVDQMLVVGQQIIFAGKTWRIDGVDDEKKIIYVTHTSGGAVPFFMSGAWRTHTKVCQRMRKILEGCDIPPILDETARGLLVEAQKNYARMNLKETCIRDLGKEGAILLTWLGTSANEALACLLSCQGIKAVALRYEPGIVVHKGSQSMDEVIQSLANIHIDQKPPLDMLLANAKNLQREKWDWALPENLLQKSYASLYLNLDEAIEWLSIFRSELANSTFHHDVRDGKCGAGI